ncbi:MAG: chromosome segregation ATPase, partial [Verrucomicrobiales bacterium]
ASVLGVGIIASQAIALGEAKENNKIEIASRLKVAGDLEMQKAANLDLTDQLVASEAKIQAVSNQKADIEVEMGRTEAAMTEQITKLDGTVAVQKKELAAKASTVGGMETALGTMKSENEAAAKKIAGLAEEIEAKAKALKESGTALDAAKAQASKLETASKELDAKLNMSGNDQDALTKELQASSDALSAAKQASAELEKQVAEMKAKIEALQKPVPAE